MNALERAVQDESERFCDAITAAVQSSKMPNGEQGRMLFQAFLAVATKEKGDRLTIAEIIEIVRDEVAYAAQLGLVGTRVDA